MSVCVKDARGPDDGTWALPSVGVVEVEARPPDAGCNRQGIATSAYQRTGTIPIPGGAEFDALSEAQRVFSINLRSDRAAITARLEGHALPPAETVGVAFVPANHVVAPSRELVELSRHWRHLAYLMAVSTGDDAAISPRIAAQATHAWSDIRRATRNRMPVPAAVTGPDGQMFYSWDRGRHHMELEIVPNEPAFFFYRDRQTGETWSEEYEVGGGLSNDVITRLSLHFQDRVGDDPASTT